MIHPLKQYRLAHNLTQAALALRSGVPQPMICRVESGNLRRFGADAARRIHEATGGEVRLEDLLYWRLTAAELSDRGDLVVDGDRAVLTVRVHGKRGRPRTEVWVRLKGTDLFERVSPGKAAK